jgi:ribosomal protein S18 acetylase RimI-like enzyme
MTYSIRKIKENETHLLDDFLYEAIFIPDGIEPPPKSIIQTPELQVYIENFGKRTGDYCLVAESGGKIIGAVWARIMNDYGHIDNETPSLAISLYKEFRNNGIGTALMKQMLSLLKKENYKRVSLAVQKKNYAAKMYQKLGFKIASENEEEYIMVCDL